MTTKAEVAEAKAEAKVEAAEAKAEKVEAKAQEESNAYLKKRLPKLFEKKPAR